MPPAISLFLLVLFLVSVDTSSDISDNGGECSAFDGCRVGDLFRTCSCQTDCHKFGTCCSDADSYPLMSSATKEFICVSDQIRTPVYAKRTCLEEFVGHEHDARDCLEAEADKAYIPGDVLVTSAKTKVTYWNRHCGICNNESKRDLREWTTQVSCPAKHGDKTFDQNYVEKNLKFNLDMEDWGLEVSDGFLVCSINFIQPRNMAGELNYCAPNLTSTCPPDFEDTDVVQKCLEYHAERKLKGDEVYFRNVHCALCNGVEEDQLDCVGRNYGPVMAVRSRADIVTVEFEEGDWLEREGGGKITCSRNNTWDSFQKRCNPMPENILKMLYEGKATTNKSQQTWHAFQPLHTVMVAIFFLFIRKYLSI